MKTIFALILPFLIAGLALMITSTVRADVNDDIELAQAEAKLAHYEYMIKMQGPKARPLSEALEGVSIDQETEEAMEMASLQEYEKQVQAKLDLENQ